MSEMKSQCACNLGTVGLTPMTLKHPSCQPENSQYVHRVSCTEILHTGILRFRPI